MGAARGVQRAVLRGVVCGVDARQPRVAPGDELPQEVRAVRRCRAGVWHECGHVQRVKIIMLAVLQNNSKQKTRVMVQKKTTNKYKAFSEFLSKSKMKKE